jgi:hypothetical protein
MKMEVWSVSNPGLFTLVTDWDGGWVCPNATQNMTVREKLSALEILWRSCVRSTYRLQCGNTLINDNIQTINRLAE